MSVVRPVWLRRKPLGEFEDICRGSSKIRDMKCQEIIIYD